MSTRNIETFLNGLRFNSDGLVPVVVQDETSHEVLMLAWMNRECILLTLAERRTVFWSRSRKEIWRKGETSGNVQELVSLSVDCDSDTLLVKVRQTGPACHTGSYSCFTDREVSAEETI